jgi:hypothetical protein
MEVSMSLWRITPSAPPDDPRWLGGPEWQEIIVRAGTAAEARVIAAQMEAARQDFRPDRNVAGAAAMDYQSPLADEGLYHVVELPDDGPGPFPVEGPPEVLVAQPL